MRVADAVDEIPWNTARDLREHGVIAHSSNVEGTRERRRPNVHRAGRKAASRRRPRQYGTGRGSGRARAPSSRSRPGPVVTTRRREKGLRWISSTSQAIWSIVAPPGAGQARHWLIDGAKVARFVRPFVPDGDAILAQIADVGVALQEPEQFVDHRLQVHALGGDEREAFRQIEAHLMAEIESVPVPVRSSLRTPAHRIRSTRSRYWRMG